MIDYFFKNNKNDQEDDYISQNIENYFNLKSDDKDHFLFVITDQSYENDIRNLTITEKFNLIKILSRDFKRILGNYNEYLILCLLEKVINSANKDFFQLAPKLITSFDQELIIFMLKHLDKEMLKKPRLKSSIPFLIKFANLGQDVSNYIEERLFSLLYEQPSYLKKFIVNNAMVDFCNFSIYSKPKTIFSLLFKSKNPEIVELAKEFAENFEELNKVKILF